MRATTAITLGGLGLALAVTTPASAGCTVPVGSRCVLDDGPVGRKCGFNSTTDVMAEAGWQTGDINVGPLRTGAAGTVRCAIVVNANTHDAPAAAEMSVRTTGGVAAMAERLRYRATAADYVTLCTSWLPDSGAPLFWVSQPLSANPFATGHWDTEPAAACSWASDPDPNDPECSIWLAVDQRAGTDLAGVWQDCEGYEPII